MLRYLVLCLCLVPLSARAYLVISDVDDTLKITNSGDAREAAWNGLFKNDVFPGMPEIFRAWEADGAVTYFVTASPKLIERKVRSLLGHHKIAYAGLTLRSNLLESKLRYKLRAISRILDANPHEDAVLIGDDVGDDPEVFAELKQRYGARILFAYVRPVQRRELPAGVVPYVTAFDVAVAEQREGRLGLGTTLDAAKNVIAGNADKLFPKFAWCPTEVRGSGLPTERAPYVTAVAVIRRIESICRERLSALESVSY